MRRSWSRDINVERLSRNHGKIVGIVGQRHCVTSYPLVMFFRVDSGTSTSRHGSRTPISDLERKRAKPTEQNGIQGKSVLGQLRVIQFIQPGAPVEKRLPRGSVLCSFEFLHNIRWICLCSIEIFPARTFIIPVTFTNKYRIFVISV